MNGRNGNDVEDGGGTHPSEITSLVAAQTQSSGTASVTSSSQSNEASSLSVEPIDNEMDRPWPATFDRGVKMLAGPVMDSRVVEELTRSPSVNVRRMMRKNQNKGYYTPDASGLPAGSPGTPKWLKKGLVRMKSLNYTFSDQNCAVKSDRPIFLPKTDREKQMLDSHAYRMEILKRSTSGGQIGTPSDDSSSPDSRAASKESQEEERERMLRSPGYQREKQMDHQKKKEKKQQDGEQKSSFWQCTFNMANILMGVGMLGLPYVFKSAGYVGGFFITVLLCLVTWRTSYYLGRELNGDPRPVHIFGDTPSSSESPAEGGDSAEAPTRMRKPIANFPGIAREAFGNRGCVCLSAVLYFELFSCLAIFLVSLGDHLHVLFPSLSQARHMTIAAFALTLPSAILRTPKLLSYLSTVGTFATVSVVLAVVLSAASMFFVALRVDDLAAGGLMAAGKEEDAGVGALEYKVYDPAGLSLALGIVAYCFSGHAIVPSIYSSMQRPQEFERMIDLTYAVVLVCCILVAVSGYYMFGDDVEDQITLSLEEHSTGASPLMTCLTWLMILTSVSKFTLTMFPLALGFEEMLTNVLPSDLAMEVVDSLVKIVLIFLALAVAVFFPSFSFLCSLVGLICTIIVSVIFPALAHLKLFGPRLTMWQKVIDWCLVGGGIAVAIVGTVATLKQDS